MPPRPDRLHQLDRIRQLAGFTDDAAIAELRAVVHPVALRAAALDALTDIARAAPELVLDALHRSTPRDPRLVRALARSGHVDRVPTLLGAILGHVDQELVVGPMVEVGHDAVEPLLWQLTRRPLSRRAMRSVFEALDALGALGHPDVVELVAGWLTERDCTRERYLLCCELLGRRDTPAVRTLLETLPTDDQARRSVQWLRGLATAGAETRFVHLALELEQRDPAAARQLSRPLRALRTDDARRLARPMLRRFLDERASWTVRDAIAGLGRSGNGSDIVRLRRFCAPSHFALHESARALARLGDPGLAEHLHRIAGVCNARDLAVVAEVLDDLDAPISMQLLADRLATCPLDQQRLLVDHLATRPRDDHDAVRDAFVDLLGRDHHLEVQPTVLAWLSRATPTPAVLDAVRALGQQPEAIAARLGLEPKLDEALVDAVSSVLWRCHEDTRRWWSEHLDAGALTVDGEMLAVLELLDRLVRPLSAREQELSARPAAALSRALSEVAQALHGAGDVFARPARHDALDRMTARAASVALRLARAQLASMLGADQVRRLTSGEVDGMLCEAAARELARRGAPDWLCATLRLSATAAAR